MIVKHNTGTGVTVITLTWTETRQFVSDAAAVAKVQAMIRRAVVAGEATSVSYTANPEEVA